MRGVLLLAIALSSPSSAQKSDAPAFDTLAVIDTRAVTAEHFRRLYREKMLKTGITDNMDTRTGYLRNLVDDEVLIAEAKREKLDRTKESRRELARIGLQESLNAFTERHIASRVAVADSELRELFVKLNTKIKVRHLYAATKAEAESLYAQLTRGKSFEELAHRVFADPQLRQSGGSLGYISVDEMDPKFEAAAYSMRVGELSRPVKTVQGYSVLRVDGIQQNPFVTESEFSRVKERLTGFARKRKLEQALAEYSASLRGRLEIRFQGKLMTRLFEATRQQWLQTPVEQTTLVISRHDLTRTLVTTKSGVWTTGRVIDALGHLTEGQRRWIRTRENLEDAIAGLVIREHIAGRAKEEKLDATPAYRERVQYAFDTYLLTSLEGELKKGIRISQDSLKSYYLQNRESFRSEPEIRLSGILLENPLLADSLGKLLDRGAAFDGLARELSVQKATSELGGDMGYFRKEALGGLGSELFAMKAGEWKGPFTQDGKYLFVKCTDVKEPLNKSFEECAGEIEEMLLSMAWRTARGHSVESYRRGMDCRVYPERLIALSLN
jgi:parvulin-like peptidyl-prolyl isomerase